LGKQLSALKEVICDSGPLAALFNSRDSYHRQAFEYFKINGARIRLLTSWEVISEVMYFLNFSAQAQSDLVIWLHEGASRDRVKIASLEIEDLLGLSTLMLKYSDRPMDLADASLVWLANRTGVVEILTVDRSDFSVYRTNKRKAFKNLFHSEAL
jgi:uncharacterized protein